ICLKCLEKEPSRRYPSALALAEDLHRFLNKEPIVARPVRPWERAWKWAKRRPTVATLLGLCALSLLTLFGVVTYAYVEQKAATARERALHESEHAAHEQAEKRAHLARRAADNMYTQVAEKWLANEPQKDELQRSFLEGALDIYRELAKERNDDPDI